MEVFNILLIAHIAGGSVSLVSGLIIMLSKKGDKRHKLFGRIYYYAMLLTATAAIPMTYLNPNYFLFLISLFTIYMLLTGVRYLDKKKTTDVSFVDWTLTVVILLFGLSFLVFGVSNLLSGNYFGLVFITFGSFGFLFSLQDYNNFTGKSKIKNFFLTTHLQRMSGSYIASTTAFLVVNNTFFPSVIAWLLPTMIITPLIVVWTRRYKVVLKNKPVLNPGE